MTYSLVLENGRVTEKLEIAGKVYTREAARLDENTTTYSDDDFCERIARDNIADEDFCDKVCDVLDSNFFSHDLLDVVQMAAERGM